MLQAQVTRQVTHPPGLSYEVSYMGVIPEQNVPDVSPKGGGGRGFFPSRRTPGSAWRARFGAEVRARAWVCLKIAQVTRSKRKLQLFFLCHSLESVGTASLRAPV